MCADLPGPADWVPAAAGLGAQLSLQGQSTEAEGQRDETTTQSGPPGMEAGPVEARTATGG